MNASEQEGFPPDGTAAALPEALAQADPEALDAAESSCTCHPSGTCSPDLTDEEDAPAETDPWVKEIDSRLLGILESAGREWGPLGVALAAASLTDREVLLRQLAASSPGDQVSAAARLAELENALNWGTSCTSCAAVLDSSIRETERAERAEERLAQVTEDLRWILPGVEPVRDAMPPKTRAAYDRLSAAAGDS
jgi:hypothetical protein